MKDRIKAIRKEKQLTQEQLAADLGLSRNFVWMVERGDRLPSDRTLRDICRLYKVNENWLRTGDGEMFAPKSRADEIAEITAALTKDRDPRKIYFAKLAAELTEEQLEMLNTMALGFLDAVDKNKKSTQ